MIAPEAQRQLRHHAERALAADDRAHEVVAGRHPGRRAEPDDLAVRQHQLEREHVMGRRAVLQRVRAARVLGGVPAERARELARRIRRVEQPVRSGRLAELGVHHAGLDHRDAVFGVDAEDAVHPRALDHDAPLERDRAARQPRSRAARHERHAVRAAGAHHARDLGLVARQHHRARQRAVNGEPVRLVNEQVLGPREHALVADDRAQRRDDAVRGPLRRAVTRLRPRDSARLTRGEASRGLAARAAPRRLHARPSRYASPRRSRSSSSRPR
jgi:hypothetical protein